MVRGRARSRARAFGRAAKALGRRGEEAAYEHGEGEAQKSHSERPEQVREGPGAPGEAEMADRVLEQPGRELRHRCVLVLGQVRECRVQGEARRRVRVDELEFQAFLAGPRAYPGIRHRRGGAPGDEHPVEPWCTVEVGAWYEVETVLRSHGRAKTFGRKRRGVRGQDRPGIDVEYRGKLDL